MKCPNCGSDKTFYCCGDHVGGKWIEQHTCVDCDTDFEVVI